MILECPLSPIWLNSSLFSFFSTGSLRAQGSLPADGLAACSHPNGGFDHPDGDFLKRCHEFLQHRLSDLHHLHCELISLRISFCSLKFSSQAQPSRTDSSLFTKHSFAFGCLSFASNFTFPQNGNSFIGESE